jgi:hypothetical protein
MLYYNFKNYEGFKELFGVVRHDNGTKSRRNKILLSFIKQRKLIAAKMQDRRNDLLNLTSLDDVKHHIWYNLRELNRGEELNLMGHIMHSNEFHTDKLKGLCFDGDYRSIRYVRNDNDRVFKMRAGKLMRKLLTQEEWGKGLPEQVIIWFCEEFAREWESYAVSNSPQYELHVDKDFNRIYRSRSLKGCFGSCMVDDGFEDFYEENVEAHAAYLTDEDDMVVARCVIFDEVCVEGSDKVYRLAERQYSSGGNEMLKQVLVNKLIEAGKIDGYKRVGADCHSPEAFLLNNGDSLNGEFLYIQCRDIDFNTLIPYMDSFKWYREDDERAYNYEDCGYDYTFENTDGHPIEGEWDEYHERYCHETTAVYVNGRYMRCDIDSLDDFIDVNGEYHHCDDVRECDEYGAYYLPKDEYYSDITEGNYCCYSCQCDAENEYISANWYYSELTYEYYETEQELKEAEEEYKQENGITEEEEK